MSNEEDLADLYRRMRETKPSKRPPAPREVEGMPARWIPLAESKPKDGVWVLRWPGMTGLDVSIDMWCDMYGCFLGSIDEGPETATHWQPLPEPPK